MEMRELGRTGVKLSLIGFGGMVVAGVPQREADEAVAAAVGRGITYFDVAPAYEDAEERLGPALEPYRNQVFLADKTGRRTRAQARAELEQSLQRLRTDHLDLYQLHAMTTDEEFEQVMAPGGAMEALVEAQQAGMVRFLGFSAHSQEVALKLMDVFAFDTVLFPVNWVNYMQADFGPAVVEKAAAKSMGRFALKAMARSQWESDLNRHRYPKCWYQPCEDVVEAELALRFTLSQPITAAIPPGQPELFWQAVTYAERFKPLGAEELSELKGRAAAYSPLFTLHR
jgi:aryl-alcohol dehydrogenase-like predicted oxidoreductase